MGETFAVGAVAQRLGVAAPTLRTWERRYGLGPSVHTAGGHRRYTSSDIARLEVMHRLVTSGIAPGQAARVALANNDEVPASVVYTRHASTRERSQNKVVRGMLRAARDLNGVRLAESIRSCLEQSGLVPCWTDVLVPLLQELGASWERREIGVASEHLAAMSIMGTLSSWRPDSAQPSVGQPPVLLAAAQDESHALPLFALRAGLLECGVASQLLGAAVPRLALAGAVRRTGPLVVFLWSSLPATGGAEGFLAVPASRKPMHVVLGGPGWDRQAAVVDPRGIRVVDDLPEAIGLIADLTS